MSSSTISTRDNSCQYPDRHISGTTCQSSYEGTFTFRGFLNGRPGYENEGGTFLYWRLSTAGVGQWYLGPTWDSTSVGAYITSSNDLPPTSGWREYCSSAWADSSLSVVDTAYRQVKGVTCQTAFESSAFTFKAVLNGRPGYENEHGKFLYWRLDSAGAGQWYLGSTWDSTSSGASIASTAEPSPPRRTRK